MRQSFGYLGPVQIAQDASPMLLADVVEVDPTSFPAVSLVESWFPDPRLPDGRPNFDGREIGTGTLIAPRLILTAGHMVYDAMQGGQTTRVRVTLGVERNQSVTDKVDFPKEWSHPRNNLDTSVVSPVDIGVIILQNPMDRYATPMRVATASDTMLAGMRLNVTGYPASVLPRMFGTQFNVIQNSGIPDGGAQYEDFRLFYPVNSFGGMSGSPVYDRDQSEGVRTIRGIHTALVNWSDGSQLATGLRIDAGIKQLIHGWIGDFGQA